MLYFAYGSNLHHEQMKRRCSGCKYLKKHILQDYRLTFRSELCVADIEYKKGSSVQGALFEITKKKMNLVLINMRTFQSCTKKYFLNMRVGM